MNRKLSILRSSLLALGLACLSAPAANAVVVTVNSVQYDVTTVSGNFVSLASTLQSQAWWGNEVLASSFSGAVGTQLGLPNLGGDLGPLFVYNTTSTTVFAYGVFQGINAPTTVAGAAAPTAPGYVWAVASPVRGNVPESGVTIAMLGAALAGLVGLRRWLA